MDGGWDQFQYFVIIVRGVLSRDVETNVSTSKFHFQWMVPDTSSTKDWLFPTLLKCDTFWKAHEEISIFMENSPQV